VRNELQRDIMAGELYLFTNARRSRAKVLHFDETGLGLYMNQLYSYCTSFGSRSVSCSLACWVSCGRRAIDESIPSAAMFLGQRLRFFVEPTVLRVRVRFDEPVFNPPYQCASDPELPVRVHATLDVVRGGVTKHPIEAHRLATNQAAYGAVRSRGVVPDPPA
jgi:hypothetical protein